VLSEWRERCGARDWTLDVAMVLRSKGIGLTASSVLMFRLTRQARSQASGFRQIAADVSKLRSRAGKDRVSAEECHLIYLLTLPEFLRLMDARGIPGRLPGPGVRRSRSEKSKRGSGSRARRWRWPRIRNTRARGRGFGGVIQFSQHLVQLVLDTHQAFGIRFTRRRERRNLSSSK
jgi:hypothetical protein